MDIASLLWALDVSLFAAGGALLLYGIGRLRRSADGGAGRLHVAWAPPRPNHLQFEHLFGVFLMFYGGLLAAQWIADRYADGPAALLYANAAGQAFGGALCLLILSQTMDGGFGKLWRGDGSIAVQLMLTGGGLCVGLAAAHGTLEATLAVLTWVAPDYQPPEHASLEALRSAQAPVWLLWCGSILIAPVAEELFFRGVLQNMLVNVLGERRWLAIVATAVVFGASHSTLPYTMPALTVLGVVLGYCYERGGGLLAPVLIHVLFNLKTFVWESLSVSVPAS